MAAQAQTQKTSETPAPAAASPLLGPNDPAPVERHNPDGAAPAVIVCDHASNAVPERLGHLGVVAGVLERHVAYDIGARGVALRLAERLDAPAILAGYSRLVIDLNRDPDDFTAIREISDGVVVPGNGALDAAARAARVETLLRPYHAAVEDAIAAKRKGVGYPAVISVHSCTDVFKGWRRPWHVGVLSNRDRRMAEPVIANLEAGDPDLVVGDNKPYSGLDAWGYTVETHALPAGLPNVLFEGRQDLLRTEAGQREMADRLAAALAPVLADPDLFRPFEGA